MDKGTIFHDITRRNALRRAHGLPLLNIRDEYAREVAVAGQRDYQARCDKHAADREAIRQEVLAELRTQHGADFGQTMGGRWAIGAMTHRRFTAFMAAQHGAVPEPAGASKEHDHLRWAAQGLTLSGIAIIIRMAQARPAPRFR
jgi:hypothetical protein